MLWYVVSVSMYPYVSRMMSCLQLTRQHLASWRSGPLAVCFLQTHAHTHTCTHACTCICTHTLTHAHTHARSCTQDDKACKRMVCWEHVLSASLDFTVPFQFLALCNSAQRGGMLYALSKSTYTQTNTDQCTQTHHICVLHICICQVTVDLSVIAESVLPVTALTG